MAIEAPLSKHKKNNFLIGIVILTVLTIWFAYDGYINKSFIEKHSQENGTPDSTLAFNRKSPPFLLGGAVILGAWLLAIRKTKVCTAEDGLAVPKNTITYESIESIDKTYFESKGYFEITYKDSNGDEKRLKLSDRTYDNLQAVLDELIAKIS